MPDAKNNRKMSGDIRPPADPAPFAPEELKQANLGADGTPEDRGQASSGRDEEASAGRERENEPPAGGRGAGGNPENR